jgi:hypothetical protein
MASSMSAEKQAIIEKEKNEIQSRAGYALGFLVLPILLLYHYLFTSPEVMKKIYGSSVLLSGLNGIGIEIGFRTFISLGTYFFYFL